MRVLVLAAHGSRRAGSNRETRLLASRVAALSDGQFDLVVPAFLEAGTPRIEDAASAAVARGAEEIVIFPHFLAEGAHVARDIPAVVARLAARFPSCRFTVAPHLGAAEDLPEVILRVAGHAPGAKASGGGRKSGGHWKPAVSAAKSGQPKTVTSRTGVRRKTRRGA